MADDLQTELLDVARITQQVNRYFQALDDRNFEDAHLRKIFTPDARITRPNGAAMTGTDEIARSHASSFARFKGTQHLASGYDVIVDGDTAQVRANLVAVHVWADGHGDPNARDNRFVAGGVITAQAVHTSDGWRISSMSNRVVWRTGTGFQSMMNTHKL